MTQSVKQTLINGTLTLTLNRPDKANALTEVMLNELAQIVETSEAQVLVITGAGKVFSAGADLDDVRNGTLATSPAWERLSSAVANFKGLSIAALNGSVAGGAFGMILAADLRISVPSAKFFYPVIKIGVLPQPSDPNRMAALIGAAHTKRLLMTGAKITAEEAYRIGLIQAIASPEALANEVETLSAPILAAKATHVTAIKNMIVTSPD